MRPGTGCQSCRSRHLKCVVPDSGDTCTRCSEARRKCEFLPRYRFRQVSHVDTASQGLRSRTELRYETQQPWVSTANPVSFVLEDGLGMEYAAEGFDMDMDERQIDAPPDLAADDEDTLNGAENDHDHEAIFDARNAETLAEVPATWQHSAPAIGTQPSPLNRSYMTPASVPELTRRYVFGVTGQVESPFSPLGHGTSGNAASPATSLPTPGSGPPPLKLSRREAFLMHHYINKIAPWVYSHSLLQQFSSADRHTDRLLRPAQSLQSRSPQTGSSQAHGTVLRPRAGIDASSGPELPIAARSFFLPWRVSAPTDRRFVG